jgi:hypothetical protein
MLLGELMAHLDDEPTAEEALLATGDLALIAGLRQAAAAEGATIGAHLMQRVADFVACAGPDDWMAVMTAASGASDPGAACLRAMLRSSVSGCAAV